MLTMEILQHANSLISVLFKILIYLVATLVILIIIFAISLKWTLNDNNYEARDFGSQFIPQLRAYKKEHGCYPDKFPELWLIGKEIPELIDLDFFYYRFDRNGECHYLLRFEDPDSTWADDGVFGNQSTLGDDWFEL